MQCSCYTIYADIISANHEKKQQMTETGGKEQLPAERRERGDPGAGGGCLRRRADMCCRAKFQFHFSRGAQVLCNRPSHSLSSQKEHSLLYFSALEDFL